MNNIYNARIQYSTSSLADWEKYNPPLNEGEMVAVLLPSGKYRLVMGGTGGTAFKDSILVWDEATAEELTANAKSSETNAASSASAAKASETNAKASENAAKASQTAAASSESNAKTSETNAKTSETNAALSESNAATSKANAKSSETSAASSASSASASASNAKKSETNAKGSETKAAASEKAAASSASAAKTSETNAKASELASSTSASNAGVSESNAKASESSAASSATSAAASADVAKVTLAGSPSFYRRSALPSPARTKITIHPTWVNIGNSGYISTSDVALDLSASSAWDASGYTGGNARAGKDFYIYACQPSSGTVPKFVLSANSTIPTGYTASNSRKIGGFHCLCLSVGAISGHALSGYVTGDILPLSVWDLLHRPVSEPEGMVWVKAIGKWVDIYLCGINGSSLKSAYGAVIADGDSNPKYHAFKFIEVLGPIGKLLPSWDEFIAFAQGSNELTNIKNSADPNTAGGHVDTAGRRMISNYGLEDCCGALWQWTSTMLSSGICKYVNGGTVITDCVSHTYGNQWIDINLSNDWWNTDATYHPDIDSQKKGCNGGGYPVRLLAGGHWSIGADCGSRAAYCNRFGSYCSGGFAGRGASEPRSVNL